MFEKEYELQTRLLLRCLPVIATHPQFALKGGTAINLFLRDLPRLSVDIDLTYLPLKPRNVTFQEIQNALMSIKQEIEQSIPTSRVQETWIERYIVKLLVSTDNATIKIEPNLILRGTVYAPQPLDLCPLAQDYFQVFVSVLTLSLPDLYGGKICAALDRQHPRDFFDIWLLLQNEGLTDHIRKAFIVYLISHSRPIVEILNPNLQDMQALFEQEFNGMVRGHVTLEELIETREKIIRLIKNNLTETERRFILSVKEGGPQWDFLGLEGIQDLPGVKWKLQNIQKMNPAKHCQAVDKLKRYLAL